MFWEITSRCMRKIIISREIKSLQSAKCMLSAQDQALESPLQGGGGGALDNRSRCYCSMSDRPVRTRKIMVEDHI